MEHGLADPLGAGRGVLITGAGGQLGAALRQAFPAARGYARTELSVVVDPLDIPFQPSLVLHAAAWTDVDGAEDHEEVARLVNVDGTRNVAALGAPVVYYSTDYVFDGTKTEPYVESDEPRPLSAYGRSKRDGELEVKHGWIVRSSWLFGWTGTNFVRTMLQLARQQNEVRVVADQRGCPTYVGHLAEATRSLIGRQPPGRDNVWHVAAGGECTWAEFAEAIFAEAGLDCRVVPIATEELGRPAPRPAYSVLRSEREGAPVLPHWREGLRECLDEIETRGA